MILCKKLKTLTEKSESFKKNTYCQKWRMVMMLMLIWTNYKILATKISSNSNNRLPFILPNPNPINKNYMSKFKISTQISKRTNKRKRVRKNATLINSRKFMSIKSTAPSRRMCTSIAECISMKELCSRKRKSEFFFILIFNFLFFITTNFYFYPLF